MRSVDERCNAVRDRAVRIRRRRDGLASTIVTLLVLFSVIDLAGRVAADGSAMLPQPSSTDDLFAAASLFGPSAGGYVLVAVATAVVVAIVTMLCVKHRLSSNKEGPHRRPDNRGRTR